MSFSKPEKKGPLSAYTIPGTRVVDRAEIFDDQVQVTTHEQDESDSRKMDMLMRQLMGTTEVMDVGPDDADNAPEEQEGEEEEEDFAFRLFSSKPVAKVNIKGNEEMDAKRLAEMVAAVAEQRCVDHDEENDPEFMARVAAASVNYDTIIEQSHWAYPAMRYPRRVMDLSAQQQQQQQAGDEKTKRKRKSKKCRDFEKAVREGRIKVLPNKRDPSTPGGWPGWPGHRTRCAIITDVSKILKKRSSVAGGRGGASRGRGRARGGGKMRGRGRGAMQKRP